ncbi:SDR family NAD(P)-dependent oxidoreductase [Fictibacillus aquaticus]|uniref:Oxidoreductase n=1 Tax=Fictibacillus aquaticus TaxID=2021314 RepID=A0A235FBQ0_9BACL|nr:SDR family oxidoreductase [Fictibacillus aquaticus]OYD58363.1 oxidoreductase [Fictibacillus aquaticus]
MKKSLSGKHVIITGASGGLGAQIALDCASYGAVPVLLARRISQLEQVKQRVKERTGTDCFIYELDVSDREQVKEVFGHILQEIPLPDVLINNAGFGVFEEFKDASWSNVEGMFQTNVLGLMACTQEVLPLMLKKGCGHIINIASQAGKVSTAKSTVYAATKHAVLGFTNGLRMEVGDHGIAVTAVNPGPIATDFFSIADSSGSYVKNVAKYMLKPETVSAEIIKAIHRPVREINLPKWMGFGSRMYQLMPSVVELLGGKAFKQK